MGRGKKKMCEGTSFDKVESVFFFFEMWYILVTLKHEQQTFIQITILYTPYMIYILTIDLCR